MGFLHSLNWRLGGPQKRKYARLESNHDLLVVQSVSYSLPRILADVSRLLRHLWEWLMRI
jgi:hypothetical protein